MNASKKSPKGMGIRLLIGLLASAAVVALTWTNFYQDQEDSIYDFRFRLRNEFFGAPRQLPSVATIDIDDLALQSFGFPFTRNRHAILVDILHRYQAAMIGFDIFFYEPSAPQLTPEEVADLHKKTFSRAEVLGLIKDYDRDFYRAEKKAGNVYLAQTFEVTNRGAEFARHNLRKLTPQKEEALKALRRSSIPVPKGLTDGVYHTTDIEVPLLNFIRAARGVGFALPKPDHDGIVRRYRLVLAYDGRLYFALGFLMACNYLHVPLQNVKFVPGSYVELPRAHLPNGTVSDIRIPVSDRCEMLINWAGPYHATFRHLPYNLILDFAETEPKNRALKIAKRIAYEHPELMRDDAAYLKWVHAEGDSSLDDNQLLEMKDVVSDCSNIEHALTRNPNLTVQDFVASMGVPKSQIPAVVNVLGGFFDRIRNNLRIYRILKENPNLSIEQVGARMGITHLEDIQLGVGILRDLIRRGGVSPEDHPLFFLDRITSAGLSGDRRTDHIVTAADLEHTVFFYGLTATGTHDLNPTPFGAREAMLGAHVNVFNTILTRDFLRRLPAWGNVAIILAFGLLIGLLVPRFRAMTGAAIVLLILSLHLVASFLLFAKAGLWVDVLGPVSTLVGGYLSITLYNYVQKEKEKEFVQGAFGHYLDPRVVDQLVDNPNLVGQLGGELRVMTAFFSDVGSFSTISENLSPVELVELLNEYLTEMCNIISRRGGTIDKFEGDAIIAFYGAPLQTDDHAECAVLAAVEMQSRIAELRSKWEEGGKMEALRKMWAAQGRGEFFRVRMGINTGEMVVGNMGSHSRVDYTIMGDAVNLASRLEGAGKAYGACTLVSETTFQSVRQQVAARELDSIRVVGKDEPVRVYEILGRDGEISAQRKEVVELYARGLSLYRECKWDQAIAMFESGLKLDPADGPCRTFIQRCQEYRQTPPPEDWDAVHILESK